MSASLLSIGFFIHSFYAYNPYQGGELFLSLLKPNLFSSYFYSILRSYLFLQYIILTNFYILLGTHTYHIHPTMNGTQVSLAPINNFHYSQSSTPIKLNLLQHEFSNPNLTFSDCLERVMALDLSQCLVHPHVPSR